MSAETFTCWCGQPLSTGSQACLRHRVPASGAPCRTTHYACECVLGQVQELIRERDAAYRCFAEQQTRTEVLAGEADALRAEVARLRDTIVSLTRRREST